MALMTHVDILSDNNYQKTIRNVLLLETVIWEELCLPVFM